MGKPYYIVLCAMCQDGYTGETACLNAHFKFETQEVCYDLEDIGFGVLRGSFNKWLHSNGFKRWYVDSSLDIEIMDDISPKNAVSPIYVKASDFV